MKQFLFLIFLIPIIAFGQSKEDSAFVRENYSKREVYIAMRDGVKLFTAIYEPRDSVSYPILMMRTPYSCSPYGEDAYRRTLGPNPNLLREKYIFVYQDVRGRYKSQGNFKEMTPAIDEKKSNNDVDESSDAYDTIEWLLKNTRTNNRVGIWGISYPGFYASASLPSAHPALKAVSPQAPVTDEFVGDDCNHNGAFFLLDNFGFYNYFDGQRNIDSTQYSDVFETKITDAYDFFLKLGPLKNSNGPNYYNGKGEIWNQIITHDTYDSFWQSRNIRPRFKNVKPAVLVVGGWFDAEDLFGALRTYEAIENQNPDNKNYLVMGPWTHGAWAAPSWAKFGSHEFGSNLNVRYREIESSFFNFYLKDKGSFNGPEATVFETGSNKWKEYKAWPPAAKNTSYYFQKADKLTISPPKEKMSFTAYESDPNQPVPYTSGSFADRNNLYMVEDQNFASIRSDLVEFETSALTQEILVTGRIRVDLYVSTTGSDADFIVKLIDAFPPDEPRGVKHYEVAGPERLVRAEVFRGKFRKSFERPQPFVPNKIEKISFDLNEIAHLFQKGHRIMVQVQSSWFPLVDRNPQKFLKIPEAEEGDFNKSVIKIYHDRAHPSAIILPVIQ